MVLGRHLQLRTHLFSSFCWRQGLYFSSTPRLGLPLGLGLTGPGFLVNEERRSTGGWKAGVQVAKRQPERAGEDPPRGS